MYVIKFYRSAVNGSSTIASFRLRTIFAKRRNSASTFLYVFFTARYRKKEEKKVKYRVPPVPLALSSLRDRAAPVDSSYSRISLRFWYDGVSRDLCKMVRSSLGSFSAWSTLYLTRAQPWRAGGPSMPAPSLLVFFFVACARREVDLRTEGVLRTLRTRFLCIFRANVRANEETNACSSRPRCFGVLSSYEILVAS